MNNTIELVEGRDFTTTGFVNFLNEKHGGKKTGKKFTIGDLQQYIRRGRLPEEYGGHPIVTIESELIGIKVLSIDFTKSVFKDGESK